MKQLQHALERIGFVPKNEKHPEDIKEDKERHIDRMVKIIEESLDKN